MKVSINSRRFRKCFVVLDDKHFPQPVLSVFFKAYAKREESSAAVVNFIIFENSDMENNCVFESKQC